jgi:hypothetical protein
MAKAYTFRRYVEATQRVTVEAHDEHEAREIAEDRQDWWNNFHKIEDTILEEVEDL